MLSGMAMLTGCAKNLGSYQTLVKGEPPAELGRTERVAQGKVRITYLGTNGYLLESRDDVVLVDPYLSRYPISRIALGAKIGSDEPRVNHALAAARVPDKVDAIVVTHGHFDHLLDVPELQRRYGGKVIASPTSCHLVAAHGGERGQLLPSLPGDHHRVGGVQVSVLPATHDLVFGRVPYDGELKAPPEQVPLRPKGWVCGVPLSFVIELGGQRIYVDSGGMPENLPGDEAIGVDLAILGVALPGSRDRFVAAVEKLHPRYVLPSHQDNFFIPLEKGFRFAGTSAFETVLDSYRKADLGQSSELILLDYFRPWELN